MNLLLCKNIKIHSKKAYFCKKFFMKRILYIIAAILLVSCSSKQDNSLETAVNYIDYVNPIIGTNGMGHTFLEHVRLME